MTPRNPHIDSSCWVISWNQQILQLDIHWWILWVSPPGPPHRSMAIAGTALFVSFFPWFHHVETLFSSIYIYINLSIHLDIYHSVHVKKHPQVDRCICILQHTSRLVCNFKPKKPVQLHSFWGAFGLRGWRMLAFTFSEYIESMRHGRHGVFPAYYMFQISPLSFFVIFFWLETGWGFRTGYWSTIHNQDL